MVIISQRLALISVVIGSLLASPIMAAAPKVSQALALKPIQSDVNFEQPAEKDWENCTIKAEREGDVSGWVVRDESGGLLRRFVDTNADNKVDQWCYFNEGVEIYRDIDSNFNGKADQYRWLGTEGSRWGLDKDEDGAIDSWKTISAEEASAEVVAALARRDPSRFKRVLLTKSELKQLGVGDSYSKRLSEQIAKAESSFASMSTRQQVVDRTSKWLHFGGVRPGVLPAGTNGSVKDVVLYDNVSAVVETGGKHSQIAIGTMIRVGDTWRVIDVPKTLVDGEANAAPDSLYSYAIHRSRPAEAPASTGVDEAIQKLLNKYDEVERTLKSTTSSSGKNKYNEQRAEILEQLIAATTDPADRSNWIHQYADTISGAIQAGDYPDGIDRLKKFHKSLANLGGGSTSAAYVKYRYMNAEYTKSLQSPDADMSKIQEDWLVQLEDFVKEYAKSDDTPDAMLQLALAQEFAGEETKSKAWYGRISREFPKSPLASKADGAVRRLDSEGKQLQLRGRSLDRRSVDLSAYRGKVVLIHYWATWCEPCKNDMRTLKELQAKYGSRGFALIGVNLDADRKDAVGHIQKARLSWPQLHEDGGLDSRLANELGILTLPAMLLVGKDGKVINRGIHINEVAGELSKRLK